MRKVGLLFNVIFASALLVSTHFSFAAHPCISEVSEKIKITQSQYDMVVQCASIDPSNKLFDSARRIAETAMEAYSLATQIKTTEHTLEICKMLKDAAAAADESVRAVLAMRRNPAKADLIEAMKLANERANRMAEANLNHLKEIAHLNIPSQEDTVGQAFSSMTVCEHSGGPPVSTSASALGRDLSKIRTALFREESDSVSSKPDGLIEIADVDIYQYPDVISRHPIDSTVSIGDLHGNTMKFIYFLIREGIMELDQGSYMQLVEIYSNPDNRESLDALNKFVSILEKAKIKENAPFFRLMGDTLADRGMNDYVTLKLYNKLRRDDAKFEVILSNHDLNFIEFFESLYHARGGSVIGSSATLPLVAEGETIGSLNSLVALLDKTKARDQLRNDIIHMMFEDYLPHVKVISYSKEGPNLLSFYSHAPVGIESVESLSSVFGVECSRSEISSDINKFTACIDGINSKFRIMSESCLFTRASKPKHVLGPRAKYTRESFDDTINHVTWNREKDLAEQFPPFVRKGVHGHTDAYVSDGIHVSLDNSLGKGSSEKYAKGKYNIFVSHKMAPKVTGN